MSKKSITKYKILAFDELKSTNSWLKGYAKKNAKDGIVVWAKKQSHGRGTLNKTWKAREGQNLTFSILHSFNHLPDFHLGFCVANSLVTFLESRGVESYCKWPNDIYIGNEKLAGILIENQQLGGVFWSVIGIGLNVNQTEFDRDLRATSMKKHTTCHFDLSSCLGDFLSYFKEKLLQYKAKETAGILNEFNENLWKKGIVTAISHQNTVKNAIIKEVNKSGELVLKVDGLGIQKFVPHEVKFIHP